MENNIKKGLILYDSSLKEFVVSKVGNKYFECEGVRRRFSIEKMQFDSQHGNGYCLYLDKQILLDTKERNKLENEIRKVMKPYGKTELSLEQLREISLIINR